jgi:hypothetical protein
VRWELLDCASYGKKNWRVHRRVCENEGEGNREIERGKGRKCECAMGWEIRRRE